MIDYGFGNMRREKIIFIECKCYVIEYFKDADINMIYINNLISDKKWDELDAYIVLLKLSDEIIAYYRDTNLEAV